MLAASTSQLAGGSRESRDYTNEFATTEIFDSREELIKRAREVGRLHGFVIVVLRSDRKKPRFTLGCERSGKCNGRSSGTKKCDCPFRLMGKKQGEGDGWELIVPEGKGRHNHEVGDTGEQGHSFRGRLSQEEKELVKDMWKTGKKPKEILGALRERDKDNKSTLRTIYNECQSLEPRMKHENICSKLRQLMSKASEYNYIEKHRATPENDQVLDFFFTHPSQLKLLLLFPTVLIVQCFDGGSWNEPMGNWTVLEISGVTSTDIKFSVGWAIFSSSTSKSSIQWALESFRGVMVDKGILMPDIVICSRPNETKIDVARTFWKATKDVFHTAKTVFSKQIKYAVFAGVLTKSPIMTWDTFSRMWELLEASPRTPTEALERHLMQIRTEYPEAAEYVINIWFKPYKEKFIPAWTDELMHFGNIDELMHFGITDELMHFGNTDELMPLMIRELRVFFFSVYMLDGVVLEKTVIDPFWKEMRSGIERALLHIKTSFEESLENEYKDEDGLSELKELHGCISIYALDLIKNQTLLANEIVDDDHSDSCTCAIKRTQGIPCKHEIAKYKREGRPIPLECVHLHWKKLHLDPLTSDEMNPEYAEDTDDKMNTETHYAAQSFPNAGPPIEPPTQEFVNVYPPLLRPYILDIKDVPRDGHCGFRAIASFLGYSEEVGWIKVREDLTNELILNSYRYGQLFGSDETVSELIFALGYFDRICSAEEHWMTMPDMGHIIASCYNIVLVFLTSRSDLCFTFFPLTTPPITVSTSPPREIVIGLSLAQKHFVQLYLKAGHPMPPPIPAPTRKKPDEKTPWETFHEQRSTEWATPYLSRVEHFKSSLPKVVSQANPIVHHIDP